MDDMARDDAGTTTSEGIIRPLKAEEIGLLHDHLLRLDAASRRDRFNGFICDDFIQDYTTRCGRDGTIVIAYVERGEVAGAAELHPPSPSDDMPEVAFSVEARLRRRGIGADLFKGVITEARRLGHHRLRITTGSDNRAMRALAAKFGAVLSFQQGESIGALDLDRPDLAILEFPMPAVRHAA